MVVARTWSAVSWRRWRDGVGATDRVGLAQQVVAEAHVAVRVGAPELGQRGAGPAPDLDLVEAEQLVELGVGLTGEQQLENGGLVGRQRHGRESLRSRRRGPRRSACRHDARFALVNETSTSPTRRARRRLRPRIRGERPGARARDGPRHRRGSPAARPRPRRDLPVDRREHHLACHRGRRRGRWHDRDGSVELRHVHAPDHRRHCPRHRAAPSRGADAPGSGMSRSPTTMTASARSCG